MKRPITFSFFYEILHLYLKKKIIIIRHNSEIERLIYTGLLEAVQLRASFFFFFFYQNHILDIPTKKVKIRAQCDKINWKLLNNLRE